MSSKKGTVFNPIDVIAGVLLVLSGLLTIFGIVNLGTVLAGLGLLIEAIKITMQFGVK